MICKIMKYKITIQLPKKKKLQNNYILFLLDLYYNYIRIKIYIIPL